MKNNIVDKIIMFLGDSGVGKTSLISQFIELELDDSKRSLIKNKQKEREIFDLPHIKANYSANRDHFNNR